jgi:hypothetical protein
MLELDNGTSLDITLEVNVFGEDQILFSLDSGGQLTLTPQQARLLATKLVMLISRAETRNSLNRKHNNFSRNFEAEQDSGVYQPV